MRTFSFLFFFVPLFLLAGLFFSACSRSSEVSFVQKGPQVKAKQLQNLEEKIIKARLEKQKAEQDLLTLKIKFYEQSLKLVENKLVEFKQFRDNLEKKPELWQQFVKAELNLLFVEERRALIQAIEECPEIASQAQSMLDSILRIITELANQKEFIKTS